MALHIKNDSEVIFVQLRFTHRSIVKNGARCVKRVMSAEAVDPPHGRKRGPSAAKTARTREAIVIAALDVFLERGFSGARILDVAQASGLAKGTLYGYFPDKQALFEEVIRSALAAPLEALATSEPSSGETLRAFFTRLALPLVQDMEQSRRGAIVRLIITESPRFPQIAQSYRQIVVEPVLERVRVLATLALETGELKTDALVRFPHLLFAPTLFAIIWNGALAPHDPLATAGFLEAHMNLVFGPTNGKG